MKYLGYRDEFINEGLKIGKYQDLTKKIMKDLGVNLYCISTFGTSVTALFPIIEGLVRNTQLGTLSTTDIVLLTICALAIAFKESKKEIDKLMVMVEEKGLKGYLEKIQYFFRNFQKLFTAIAKSSGKVINGIIDMFAYSVLLVPFMVGMVDLINSWNLGFDSFNHIMVDPLGFAISTGIGVVTITVKHLVNMLVKKIKRLTAKKEVELKNPVFTGESLNVDKIMEYLKS